MLSNPEEKHDFSHEEKKWDREQRKGTDRSKDAENQLCQPDLSPKNVCKKDIDKKKRISDRNP
jgi:hypothetical protein